MALCICSAQSKNRYNSVIVLHTVGNSTLYADSGIVPDNTIIVQGIYIVLSSDMICGQSRNRVGQSRRAVQRAVQSENNSVLIPGPDISERLQDHWSPGYFCTDPQNAGALMIRQT